jgi:hypothetical protein
VNEFQELLQELLAVIQQVMQSGEVLSDEFQGELAQTISLLMDRSNQAQTPAPEPTPETQSTQPTTGTPGTGEGQLPTGGKVPQMEQAPFESSNISGFRYEPEDQSLFIQFLGKHPDRNGPVYKYGGVPVNLFNLLRRGAIAPRTSGKNAWHRWEKGKVPSHGASAYALIREGGYPYERIS